MHASTALLAEIAQSLNRARKLYALSVPLLAAMALAATTGRSADNATYDDSEDNPPRYGLSLDSPLISADDTGRPVQDSLLESNAPVRASTDCVGAPPSSVVAPAATGEVNFAKDIQEPATQATARATDNGGTPMTSTQSRRAVIAIGIEPPVTGFMIAGSTGNSSFFALSFFCVLFFISGLVIVVMFAAMEIGLARTLADQAPLLKYTMKAQEYQEFAAAEGEEIRLANRAALSIMLVFCGLVACVGPFVVKHDGIVLVFTGIGLGIFLALMCTIITRYHI